MGVKIHNVAQLLNAVTMVAPLLSLLRNCRKRGSKTPLALVLCKVMCVHIPISFAYHLTHALSRHSTCINILKSIDYFMVHITTLIPLLHPKVRQQRKCICILGHALSFWFLKDMFSVYPYVKFLAICSSTSHLVKEHRDYAFLTMCYGSIGFLLYVLDGWCIPYGHAMFHITLYPLFNNYHALLNSMKGENMTKPNINAHMVWEMFCKNPNELIISENGFVPEECMPWVQEKWRQFKEEYDAIHMEALSVYCKYSVATCNRVEFAKLAKYHVYARLLFMLQDRRMTKYHETIFEMVRPQDGHLDVPF